ncbi:MAG: proline--tRNA ligase [Planctomycetota bacterium]|jgi:prolyl-tRNA synthetase
MRWTNSFIPTLKEVPAEAEIPSHRLMIRAGFIRKLASGTYSYLPLGWRSLNKIVGIVREEMDAAGALEVLLPSVQPIELWQQTGRDADYGETMARFEDRHGRMNVLAPTAEEVVTSVAAAEIRSYKQLPVNLYQISFKFRDEFRPRFGVLRSREFIMKDAYSFDADAESLEESYRKMYRAYCRVFSRCGIPYVIVEAESGEMGGSGSHQFTVPCETGEDVIVTTEDGSYAANLEKAGVDAPPADPELDSKRAAVAGLEEVHTPDVGTIEAVCGFMKTRPEEMIKTLVYTAGEGEVVVCLVRGDHDVNPEKLTGAVGGRHTELADAETIEKVTGAAVGFAGPMGLAGKVSLLLVDQSVAAMAAGVTGANRTDHHVRNAVPGRDFPLEGKNVRVADLRNAAEGDTRDGEKLLFKHGIEVGQVFKLGSKYAAKLDCSFLDENHESRTCTMGCYGIGVNRILASAIETGFDKDGICWPASIAPYEVLVLTASPKPEAAEAAGKIYDELRAGGVDVLFDDRADVRPGVKFKDADLIGIPLRIVVGDRGLKEGVVELVRRRDKEMRKVPPGEAAAGAAEMIAAMKAELLAAADRA